jgi:hypothetical protein
VPSHIGLIVHVLIDLPKGHSYRVATIDALSHAAAGVPLVGFVEAAAKARSTH